ncbi:hypothetical protein SPRG_18509, partial [Saprolegnia parasitica CBS 223.65]
LVVGYGTESVDDGTTSVGFFKVRNAWGANWGEHGHIRLEGGLNREPGTRKLAMYVAFSMLPSPRGVDATPKQRSRARPATCVPIDVENAAT